MSTLNTVTNKSRIAVALACTLALPAVMPVAANAQIFHRHTTTTTHRSWFHRHPTATTAGAGLGAYALAKRSHHGIFHRHPVLTGVAAAAIAHHYAKKRR